MPAPRIGINCELEQRRRAAFYELPAAYVAAVRNAGGFPILLPNVLGRPAAARILDSVDGIVFSGGDDMHPRRYGERLHPSVKLLHPEKEESDFLLMREALRRDLPMLAICGGFQLLNVVRGGSLVQDIPSQVPRAVAHRARTEGRKALHPIEIEPGTMLQRLLRRRTLLTNSSHHQAVKKLGRGIRVSARARDGLIEAVEVPDRRFTLAVQWHPERMADRAPHALLFRALVRAAGR